LHPVGVEGAQLMAFAVAMAIREASIQRNRFLTELLHRATTEPFQWALKSALQIKRHNSISSLGSTLHADRSVITAIVCFLDSPTDFDLAVGRAISLGDDTDTLAAMTGALIGAHNGLNCIPPKHLALFEKQVKDLSHIRELATQLHSRFTSSVSVLPAIPATS
jgi:poly(ADP-ribose) glycohydrolase ARH3